MVNFDHGILPALNTIIKTEFDLDDVQMGALGSVVYLGNVVGSLLGMPLFKYFSTKWILACSLIFQMASLTVFTQVGVFMVLEISRFLTGITQVLFTIYIPIWADFFAPKDKKSQWMTTIIGGVTLGMLSGYLVTALISSLVDWRWSFYI